MLISGIDTFSLIDYPSKSCCIVFTLGCNLRCKFCYNSEFVLPEKVNVTKKNLISLSAFFNFLDSRVGLLDGVSICGGEPTLQPDLEGFCRKIKKKGFLVKLDTNGRDPKMLKKLITRGLVDYVAMDIKNPIGDLVDITCVQEDDEQYKKSIQVLLSSGMEYEFRTTVIKGFHTAESILKISQYICGAKNYYLQNYRPGDILDANFKGESFSKEELLKLQAVAQQSVKNVGIRA